MRDLPQSSDDESGHVNVCEKRENESAQGQYHGFHECVAGFDFKVVILEVGDTNRGNGRGKRARIQTRKMGLTLTGRVSALGTRTRLVLLLTEVSEERDQGGNHDSEGVRPNHVEPPADQSSTYDILRVVGKSIAPSKAPGMILTAISKSRLHTKPGAQKRVDRVPLKRECTYSVVGPIGLPFRSKYASVPGSFRYWTKPLKMSTRNNAVHGKHPGRSITHSSPKGRKNSQALPI